MPPTMGRIALEPPGEIGRRFQRLHSATVSPMLVCAIFAACLLAVPAAADTTSDLSPTLLESSMPRVRSHLGLMRLSRINLRSPPAACVDFQAECKLEKAGQLGKALARYEDRMPNCSLAGWHKQGNLGTGQRVTMGLWKTPCGSEVAVKSAQVADLVKMHIAVDCDILRLLGKYQNHALCNHCFPEFYYRSPLTKSGACYSERVAGVTSNLYLDTLNVKTPRGLARAKAVFKQAMGVLAVLNLAGVRHRDMVLTNMMVRLPTEDAPKWQVMFIDFGGSYAPGVDNVAVGSAAGRLASRGQTDSFMLACLYYRYYYGNGMPMHVCPLGEVRGTLRNGSLPEKSFGAFLLSMMNVTTAVRHEAFHFTMELHDELVAQLKDVAYV